jgi:hypothetical protein
MSKTNTIEEVEHNYARLMEQQDELKALHLRKFALLHHTKIIGFYDSEDDAIKVGMEDYSEGNFSVQAIGDRVVDSGDQLLDKNYLEKGIQAAVMSMSSIKNCPEREIKIAVKKIQSTIEGYLKGDGQIGVSEELPAMPPKPKPSRVRGL